MLEFGKVIVTNLDYSVRIHPIFRDLNRKKGKRKEKKLVSTT